MGINTIIMKNTRLFKIFLAVFLYYSPFCIDINCQEVTTVVITESCAFKPSGTVSITIDPLELDPTWELSFTVYLENSITYESYELSIAGDSPFHSFAYINKTPASSPLHDRPAYLPFRSGGNPLDHTVLFVLRHDLHNALVHLQVSRA